MKKVNIDYFFKHPHKFPWDYLGLTKPVMGASYSYLCSWLADFEPPNAVFFKGKPSLHQLEEFSRESGGIARQVLNFYNEQRVKESKEFGKQSVVVEVVKFLKEFEPFRQAFQKKIDKDIARGLVSVPEEAFEETSYRNYY